MKILFDRSWQFIGDTDLLSKNNVHPGILLEGMIDEPYLLTKENEDIRCLSNVCTHRGNIVCSDSCKVKTLVCGYHGRQFEIGGKMKFMPEFDDVNDFPNKSDDFETAQAYGMRQSQVFWRILVPQMWVYALPGLSNLWMVLIKATPLLFLLGVEDIVYWARELGGTKQAKFSAYPHEDWRMYYFLFLLIFYLAFTKVSEIFLERIMKRLTHGQGTLGGAA